MRMPSGLHSFFDWLLHTLHWGDVPAYLSAVIAIVFGFLSWRSSRKSKEEREAAEHAMEIAKQHADAAKRSANVDETQLGMAQAQAEAAEQRPWRIDPTITPNSYRLLNTTPTAKYFVTITGAVRTQSATTVPGGGEFTFERQIGVFGQRDVTVHWHRTNDPNDKEYVQEGQV